ncbi:MAG: ABC transporter permease [Bacteroidetes bacterium]|nr:ABC transporter permease [Bacteroidota bacterium]
MFKNYLKIAYRNLIKQKLHSTINITGLAIGMAVSILILSYVWFHLSFDRFHSKSDQTYRVVQSFKINEKERNWGRTSYTLAAVLREEFPEIIHVARLNHYENNADIEININGKKFIEKRRGENLVRADNDIFKIFDIVLVQGDSETALEDPNSIIITEDVSRKYFGNENPMGNVINIRSVKDEKVFDFKITGVARKMPDNSHFEFKYLIPQEKSPWYWYKYASGYTYTYLTLPVDYPIEDLESKFPGIVKKHFTSDIEDWASVPYKDWLKSGGYWTLQLQGLKNIHLDQHYHSTHLVKKEDSSQVRLYSLIALFIIVLACINFVTLSTAKSGIRAKEVGVRKVNGAKRVQLIWQFLTESILLSIIALVFAVLMVLLFYKPFSKLLEIQTSFNTTVIVFMVSALFILTLLVGVIAGSYPAFFLSAFKPVNVLKGQLLGKMKGMKIRNSLVIFQFVISMVLIISSIVVYKQFVYMQNKDLGFDKGNIVIVKEVAARLWLKDRGISQEERITRMETFKQELLKNSNVTNVSYARSIQGTQGVGYDLFAVKAEGALPEKKSSVNVTHVDHDYKNLFALEIADGKNFKKSLLTPQIIEGVIINEKAANFLELKNPVGKYIYFDKWYVLIEGKWVGRKAQFPIIGVFKDFHTHNLHQAIQPTIYFPLHRGDGVSNFISVRFMPGNIRNNIAFLEKKWEEMGAIQPLEYSFFDQEFDNLYRKEKKLAQVFTFFSILALFIACLGIFGLAALTAEQRTKEIGIRKVVGASEKNVVLLLSRIYLKLLIVASLLACPVGYFIMHRWLQEFPFRIKQGADIFILTEIIVLVIVVSSVSYYLVKAAFTNPVRTLKYE